MDGVQSGTNKSISFIRSLCVEETVISLFGNMCKKSLYREFFSCSTDLKIVKSRSTKTNTIYNMGMTE